jgi:hypothetical protein
MHLDFWDYVTFLSFFILGVGAIAAVIFVLGLPGRIAYARKNPDAEAINIMGWLGFVVVVPWVQAFIWAFKPTTIVDIRRYPKEEKDAIDEEMLRHFGKPPTEKAGEPGAKARTPAPDKPA